GHGHVLRNLAGVVDREAAVRSAQEATVAGAAATDRDDAGERDGVIAQEVAGDRASARDVHAQGARRKHVVQAVRAASVIAFTAVQRADDRQVLEVLGGVFHQLANLDARSGGVDRLEVALVGGANFDVPGVHVAGAAAHPQDDQVLAGLLQGG